MSTDEIVVLKRNVIVENLTVSPIPLELTYYKNPENDELYVDDELSHKNDIAVFDINKYLSNKITTKETIELRERYGCTQEEFSLILGFDKKDIHNLEDNFYIPNEYQDRTLRSCDDPLVMIGYYGKYRYRLNNFESNDRIFKTIMKEFPELDMKSAKNLLNKSPDYIQQAFRIPIDLQLQGSIPIDENQYVHKVDKLLTTRLNTKFSTYDMNQIFENHLRPELQKWIKEDIKSKGLLINEYKIKYDPSESE